MGAFLSISGVLALVLVAIIGAKIHLQFLLGVVVPYVAFLFFVVGMVLRFLKWGRTPVPFRIPTTCGQQKSLPWIKQNKIENPSNSLGVILRMALEVLTFRSLFRNTKSAMENGKLTHVSNQWLWLGGLAFHWSFLIIVVRHFRFFSPKVPVVIQMVEGLDSFLQIGVPLLYMTDLVLIGAVTYLFIRRVIVPNISYISLPADFFPLALILGIGLSGILMRYVTKVHVVGVKQFTLGLLTLHPTIPEGIGTVFWVHLFLVSMLLMYFPFSKLVHMGGVFMSPTRNMANNSRFVRHVNPWNYPVKVHTYQEYEDDFRDKMIGVGLPVDKQPEPEPAENEAEKE